MERCNRGLTAIKKDPLPRKLDAAGWGLFFVWTGISFLADVGWGAGLLGVGFITLGTQTARRYFGLELEGFWIVVGFLFILGGIWRLFQVQFNLWPILCVAIGVTLLASILAGRAKNSGLSDRCQ
jgi:hypothetical protein